MVTADTFKLSEVDDRIYVLSLQVRPGSIRDSMWRAQEFIEQLRKTSRVRANSRVLVVGLGPSGMAAVHALLKMGVRVVACNTPPHKSESVLSLCDVRKVCPTTFDWPASHWSDRTYPFQGCSGDISWNANISRDAISQMQKVFKEKTRSYGTSVYVPHGNAHWSDFACNKSNITVSLSNNIFTDEVEGKYEVDLVIVCAGPGRQADTLESSSGVFRGYGFWSNDDNLFVVSPRSEDDHQPPVDRRQLSAPIRIAILGAQDGGLGDFNRLLTGKHDPHEILGGLNLAKGELATIWELNKEMWDLFEKHRADTDGVQADNKNNMADQEHFALESLQAKSMTFLRSLWGDQLRIRDAAANLLNDANRQTRRPHVQLVVDCTHFNYSYFANRVAAHLLARALTAAGLRESNGNLHPFRVGMQGSRIEGLNGHICRGDADSCAVNKHRLHFVNNACNKKSNAMPSYMDACCGTGNGCTVTLSREAAVFDRIVMRCGRLAGPMRLPERVQKAIENRRRGIRHLPPFYTEAV